MKRYPLHVEHFLSSDQLEAATAGERVRVTNAAPEWFRVLDCPAIPAMPTEGTVFLDSFFTGEQRTAWQAGAANKLAGEWVSADGQRFETVLDVTPTSFSFAFNIPAPPEPAGIDQDPFL